MRHGLKGVPRSGFQDDFARPIGRGATRHGETVDAPGHQAGERHGVQPPLRRLHASWLHLTALLAHPKNACDLPPTSIPLHHRPGTGEIRHRQARAPQPVDRLLAARGAARLRIDSPDLDGGPPASRPAGALAWHPLDRYPEGDLSRRPGGLPRQLDRQTACCLSSHPSHGAGAGASRRWHCARLLHAARSSGTRRLASRNHS
jgi:hypothetical protein